MMILHRQQPLCFAVQPNGSLTCLAAMAAQSFAATGRPAPPALSDLLEQVLEICPPIVERRSLGAELGRLAAELGSGIPE